MQNSQPPLQSSRDNTTTLYCFAATLFFSLLFVFTLYSPPPSPPPTSWRDPKLYTHHTHYLRNPNPNPNASSSNDDEPLPPPPPSFAYFISGSTGDLTRILRLLFAVYHPKNLYLLHLDRFAPQSDRDKLAMSVLSVPIFGAAKNVHVIGKADFAYPKGSSPVASVLRGASILLRLSPDWDWFINLSANDYPLVTQDDLLHIFSFLPRELNFANHSSYIGWKESRRIKPIIVDPGLYLRDKAAMFYASQRRILPSAYQLFTGPSMSILSRKFVEFSILSSDNLPRTLLLYFANTPSSLLNYFPTILCNTQQFAKTTINDNMQFASFPDPLREEPKQLNSSDFDSMIQSGSAFSTQIQRDDPLLNRIDLDILGRQSGKVVPGGWCLGPANDTCADWGHADILRPGPGAKRLEKRLVEILEDGKFKSRQCMVE